MTPPIRFNLIDYCISRLWWGCVCEHAALAAILGVRLGDARRLTPDFSRKAGMSSAMMRAAIERAGRLGEDCGKDYPAHGVVLIAFDNPPWHWLAVSDGKVADNNSRQWMPLSQWERRILPRIRRRGEKTWVHCGIEVIR